MPATVFITTVSNATFSPLATVVYDPFTDSAGGSTQVTLTDSSGVLATGVIAIRFTAIDNPGDSLNEVGVIRELDVFGVETVPEPATMALLALAATGLGGYVRRRRAA